MKRIVAAVRQHNQFSNLMLKNELFFFSELNKLTENNFVLLENNEKKNIDINYMFKNHYFSS